VPIEEEKEEACIPLHYLHNNLGHGESGCLGGKKKIQPTTWTTLKPSIGKIKELHID
jgi:hypothetical protein